MWIREYRESKGLELWQLQQRVNTYGKNMKIPLYGIVSAQLIHMLEVDKNAVTHPRIANIIAVLCEATPEQRDMIVADTHKGTWKGPTPEERELADKVNRKPFVSGVDYHKKTTANGDGLCDESQEKHYTPKHARPVVKIDTCGFVVKRFDSAKQAADYELIERSSIKCRCQRKVRREFYMNGVMNQNPNHRYTYRYADEWDKMTAEEKMADIKRSIAAEEYAK